DPEHVEQHPDAALSVPTTEHPPSVLAVRPHVGRHDGQTHGAQALDVIDVVTDEHDLLEGLTRSYLLSSSAASLSPRLAGSRSRAWRPGAGNRHQLGGQDQRVDAGFREPPEAEAVRTAADDSLAAELVHPDVVAVEHAVEVEDDGPHLAQRLLDARIH